MTRLMKVVVRPETLSPEKYKILCERLPEGQKPNLFRVELPADWKTAVDLVSFLEAEGLKPHHASQQGYFEYRIRRVYEDSDFETLEYLRMSPNQWISIGEEGRNAKGEAIVDPSELEKGLWYEFKAGFTETAYFVLDSIKRALEAGGFVGMAFRETEWKDPIRAFRRERIWELYSQIELAKLANVQNLVHARNESFAGDYSRPIWVREEPFARGDGELCYRKAQLSAVGPFDLAHTFELHQGRKHSLVASRRLYHYCREHQLPFTWQPVRIDPD